MRILARDFWTPTTVQAAAHRGRHRLSAGDSDVLQRIKPGPSSNSLVVASVEIYFDAD